MFKTGVCYTVLPGLDIAVTLLPLRSELGFQAFPTVLEIFSPWDAGSSNTPFQGCETDSSNALGQPYSITVRWSLIPVAGSEDSFGST